MRGSRDPDYRIDIVVSFIDGFGCDRFSYDISFLIYYRYKYRMFHDYIEIDDTELVEYDAKDKYGGGSYVE